MPIPVACRCGRSFAANDNLAGKTVKCPGCQQPLQIPSPSQQGSAPQRTAEGKIVVACGCGAKFAAGPELAGKRVKCPKCGQALTVGESQPEVFVAQTVSSAQAVAEPISVACACGARFAAKPELRGKTVKCPKCSQPLVVGGGSPAPVGAGALGTAALAAPPAPALGGNGFGLHDHLDDVGVKAKATGENACPYCGAFMAPEALICIECGYNRKTGKTLQVKTVKKVEAKKLGPPTAAAKAGAASSVNPYAAPQSLGSYSAVSSRDVLPASQGKRFANLFIDGVVTNVLSAGAGILVGVVIGVSKASQGETVTPADEAYLNLMGTLLGLGIYLVYYVGMESLFGKTIGKFVTSTRVVNATGAPPSFGQVVGRTFARLIPFEAFSFFGGKGHPVGWHDSLSNTRVIDG